MNQILTVLRWALACAAGLIGSALWCQPLYAQAGLRESLEALDTNQDGAIDPDEITPLARPYLERIFRERRMPIGRPNDIEQVLDAARVYYAVRNGISGRDVRPASEDSVIPFGPKPNEPLVPSFGLAKVKFPYTQDDLDFADRTMRSHDRNSDGFIDRAEAARNRWTHRRPFLDDLDKDGRLSRLELAQRYARRRLLEDSQDEMWQQARRIGNGVRPGAPRYRDDREGRDNRDGRSERESSQSWRSGGSRNWLTASVLSRFDLNRNGRLELTEAQNLGIPSGQIDIDRDGDLSREELQAFLTDLQDEVGDLSEGLPGWFFELDADRDGQIAMPEFTTEWTNDKLQEFSSLDTNGDGLLTSLEVAQSKALVGGSYHNQNAEILAPRKTIISEIEISDDFLIADLNVQISITHSNTSFLDAYLTGPDGQRIELFTEVGGSGDHFDQTILDDQSRYPITKARPPFKGTFMPEALVNRQPSLSHFNGKNAKGVWQLVIRGTRSERFGMLHSWDLIVRPQDGMLGGTAAAPLRDGPQPGTTPVAGAPQERSEGDKRFGVRGQELAKPQRSPSRPEVEASGVGGRRVVIGADKEAQIEARKRAVMEKYKQLLESKKLEAKKPSKGETFPDKEKFLDNVKFLDK